MGTCSSTGATHTKEQQTIKGEEKQVSVDSSSSKERDCVQENASEQPERRESEPQVQPQSVEDAGETIAEKALKDDAATAHATTSPCADTNTDITNQPAQVKEDETVATLGVGVAVASSVEKNRKANEAVGVDEKMESMENVQEEVEEKKGEDTPSSPTQDAAGSDTSPVVTRRPWPAPLMTSSLDTPCFKPASSPMHGETDFFSIEHPHTATNGDNEEHDVGDSSITLIPIQSPSGGADTSSTPTPLSPINRSEGKEAGSNDVVGNGNEPVKTALASGIIPDPSGREEVEEDVSSSALVASAERPPTRPLSPRSMVKRFAVELTSEHPDAELLSQFKQQLTTAKTEDNRMNFRVSVAKVRKLVLSIIML